MARATRRNSRKGGKRKGGTRRRLRGGSNCADAKTVSATAVENIEAAREAAERASAGAKDAMHKALRMNNRALETEGGQALQNSIAQMDRAIGDIESAAISMAAFMSALGAESLLGG